MNQKYTNDQRTKAKAMIIRGSSITAIAEATKMPVRAVQNLKYRMKKQGVKPDSNGKGPDARVADALTFLRHGRASLMKSIRSGEVKHPTRADLHMLLALDSLEGK